MIGVKHIKKYGKYEYTVWGEEYGCDDSWFPVEVINTKSVRYAVEAYHDALEDPAINKVKLSFCVIKDKKKEEYPVYNLCVWSGEETLSHHERFSYED
tara:strand:+ start:5619 stop:5912 length:294 start_codon:yes stop_codon:yes gene_type:complete